ncbi:MULTISPECIES: hypothetical protein [Sutcliffiella]|nr:MULTISPECIES: hypothetical protein [Sutcliffiella]WBL16034.1 hypothetical protein O1A01_05205 [Sutcliffiella sp. NC1]
MMSFATVSFMEIIKKQYRYKLRAYSAVFTSFIVLQVIGLLFSTTMTGSAAGGSIGIDYQMTYYTNDVQLIFTFIWIFTSALLLTTTAYRNDDLTFVSTRLSSSISNIAFLATASIIGAIFTWLSHYFLYVVIYVVTGQQLVLETDALTVFDIAIGVVITMLYILLISSAGYFVGVLGQVHKAFRIIIPAIVFGIMINSINVPIVQNITAFFGMESSFLLFTLKVFIVSGALFYSATFLMNRLEGK